MAQALENPDHRFPRLREKNIVIAGDEERDSQDLDSILNGPILPVPQELRPFEFYIAKAPARPTGQVALRPFDFLALSIAHCETRERLENSVDTTHVGAKVYFGILMWRASFLRLRTFEVDQK